MSIEKLQEDIGGIDIYVLDQILKQRYAQKEVILDAGCGSGRNIKWFYNHNYTLYGVENRIVEVQEKYPEQKNHFSVQNLDSLPFREHFFDHVICCAVLHFAANTIHFKRMVAELFRVLKPGGSLLIRMASNFGMENVVKPISDGVYLLPDTTNRFLLTRDLLAYLEHHFSFSYLEPLKTVNVNNIRCMSTLVFTKK
jgi:tellurite methyltransferase